MLSPLFIRGISLEELRNALYKCCITYLLTLISTEVFRSSEILDTIAFYYHRDCNDTRTCRRLLNRRLVCLLAR